ncbi:hypothetical protein GFS60_07036 (plasmid) [Rhodococcus sp. WAY2]|nr:hypothetical protein GFS60_07036 [Rhodococcus sp. WAY2]
MRHAEPFASKRASDSTSVPIGKVEPLHLAVVARLVEALPDRILGDARCVTECVGPAD